MAHLNDRAVDNAGERATGCVPNSNGERQFLATCPLSDPQPADAPNGTSGEAIWWRQLVEQSRDGIVVIDRHGKVFWANDEFASMLGCTRVEAQDLEVWDWDAKIPRNAIAAMLDDVGRTGDHFETVHTRRDGSTYDVEICTNAIVCDGHKLILCICRDITRRKQAELEMQRLLAATQSLAEQLARQKDILVQAEKLASLGRLAAGIAHEINNPLAFVQSNFTALSAYVADLAAVAGSAQALVDLPVPIAPVALESAIASLRCACEEADAAYAAEDARQLLADNAGGVARIRAIVNDMKVFMKRVDADPSRVSIRGLIESAVAATSHEWESRGEVILDLADDLPEVTWFPEQIDQAIKHLVVNAAYALEGQGRITITARVAASETVRIIVSDNGVGIPEADLSRIFDPFYTTRSVGEGIGLGLYLVHSFVERHGGNVAVASRVGAGTGFTLTLPLRVPDDAPARLPGPSGIQ